MTVGRTPGVYHLVIHLARPRRVQVGRLGRFDFPGGYYVYTGSAMGGLEARLARHRRREKKLWWHIDYLLRAGRLVEEVALRTERREECERNQAVFALPGASLIALGFGASDCRCASHLAYLGGRRPKIASGQSCV